MNTPRLLFSVIPVNNADWSIPSMTIPSGSADWANFTTVGNKSSVETISLLILFAGTIPGARMIQGTLNPPSQEEALAPRRGKAEPVALFPPCNLR